MDKIIFTYTKNYGENKKVQKDDKGWYRMNFGAINAFNAHGDLYLADGVHELIKGKSSRLAEKLAGGYLEGEKNHPSRQPGMKESDFLMRVLKIDTDRVSHHIRDLEIIDTGMPTGNGVQGNILAIVGWVKPVGPYGEELRQKIEDPDINVAFSIRSLTSDKIINGTRVKKIENIITFDYVDEPGISLANKFDTMKYGFESFDSPVPFTREVIVNAYKDIERTTSKFGQESSYSIGLLKDLLKKSNNSARQHTLVNW